jgi:hypothetical protein
MHSRHRTSIGVGDMRNLLVRLPLLGALGALVLFLPHPMVSLADEAIELVDYMVKLQYFSHKTGLSIQAKNEPLTRFYLHELEEVIEKLKKVKEYEGHPISALAQQILEPAFEKLEKSVEAKQLTRAQADYEAMLHACNNCHQSTAHGFIKIEQRFDNPFMQSFAP